MQYFTLNSKISAVFPYSSSIKNVVLDDWLYLGDRKYFYFTNDYYNFGYMQSKIQWA